MKYFLKLNKNKIKSFCKIVEVADTEEDLIIGYRNSKNTPEDLKNFVKLFYLNCVYRPDSLQNFGNKKV